MILAVVGLTIPSITIVYADGNGDIFCDGNDRDYEGISELPELDKDKCYGTCEQMSKGLACDIEKIEK